MGIVVTSEPRNIARGSWVEIDLQVLEDNVRAMQQAVSPDTEIVFVVKSNAYGHGLIPLSTRAAKAGIRWFAVVNLDEALELRAALPDVRILVLGVTGASEVGLLAEHCIIPVVVSEWHGLELAAAARLLQVTLPVHLKVDTGMGRLGVAWSDTDRVLEKLGAEPGLDIQGLCSHFATVEPQRPDSAMEQVERFKRIRAFGNPGYFRHLSSSRAFLYFPQCDFDAVRCGISLYGYGADEEGMRVHTRPILQWKTQVIQVKTVPADFPVGYYSAYRTTAPTDIATISVGYADGYPRLLSNKGHVLIGGERCHVVGRISMNWVTVDVGPDSGVREGDEVVLIGEQGRESVWAGEIARLSGTIAYEVLTSIHPSAKRHYLD